MKQNPFCSEFLDLLRSLYDAENQIVISLPKLIQECSNNVLKEALTQHLDETKNQIQRLKKIFKTVNENPTGIECKGMRVLFEECNEELKKNLPTAVRDAMLIVACQKVEHYEIACYGSARTWARHLNNTAIDDKIDFDEIADILQQSLDEESAADEKLTDIAEGGFFSRGINEEAEKVALQGNSTSTGSKKSTPNRDW